MLYHNVIMTLTLQPKRGLMTKQWKGWCRVLCLPWRVVFTWHPLIRLVYLLLASVTKVTSAWSRASTVIRCMTRCVIHSQQLLCCKDADSNQLRYSSPMMHITEYHTLFCLVACVSWIWVSTLLFFKLKYFLDCGLVVMRRYDRLTGSHGEEERTKQTGTHRLSNTQIAYSSTPRGCFSFITI